MARRPEGPAPPPVVQRMRVRYAKRGRLRFASHRDFARVFERALRRSGVPMAYSAGFTPHPKISYAGAAPTGAASEAEFLELGLARAVDAAALRVALNGALPDGLDVVEVVEVPGGDSSRASGALPERLTASAWDVALPGLAPERVAAAVAVFLAREEVLVERLTKSGRREVDVRAAVVTAVGTASAGDDALRASSPAMDGPCAILNVVVRHVTPAVRPDDVLTGLRLVADLVLPQPPTAVRRAQGLLGEDGSVDDPLAPDRIAGVGLAEVAPGR